MDKPRGESLVEMRQFKKLIVYEYLFVCVSVFNVCVFVFVYVRL